VRKIVVIAHNVRSSHNVGSLLRTAEGLGVSKIYLTGYTPYPVAKKDTRLPHVATRATRQIHKTALGAEDSITWEQTNDVFKVIVELKRAGYMVAALEQAPNSQKLPDFAVPEKVALIVGREVEGLESEVLKAVDTVLEIPMHGNKESFNVTQAAAMALYHFCHLAK
jgi:23S rRNA (guanosine2251-2'-O)-methyltransferase